MEKDAVKVNWLKTDQVKVIVYLFAVLSTGGILYLIVANSDWLYRYLTTSECSPDQAQFVMYESDGHVFYSVVDHHLYNGETYCSFEASCVRYLASKEKGSWVVSQVPDAPANFSDIYVYGSEVKQEDRQYMKVMYGPNHMYIASADFMQILLSNVTAPFYLFQYFAVAVWLYTNYIAYSCIVLLITIGSIYFTTKEELFNLERLHKLADTSGTVKILSDQFKGMTKQSDSELVPGDRFEVEEHMVLPCDAILIHGRVVVDESMLTGESVPVTKTPIDESTLAPNEPRPDATKRTATVLFSGTHVKYVSPGAIAVCYKTGFRSAKGQLVAALLVPKVCLFRLSPHSSS